MGLVDLKDYTINKVKPGPGIAGKISCAMVFVAAIFVLGTYLGTAIRPGREEFFRALEVVSLLPTGMNQTIDANQSMIPYPQMVFCPMWKEGQINNMNCYKAHGHGFFDHLNNLTVVKMPSQYTSSNPNNVCWGYNTDGKAMPDWTWTVMCEINSTDVSGNVTWAGRVRLYLDPTGAKDFEGCQYCIDGIDGTLLVQGYTTMAFWQTNYFAARYNHTLHARIDYRAESNRLPYEPTLNQSSDMTFIGGFFTPAVWLYERPDVLREQGGFHGEEFAHRAAFFAALVLVSYFIWSCLSATIILLVVGEEGLRQ